MKKRRGLWPMQHLVAMRKNCSWAIWRTDLFARKKKNKIIHDKTIQDAPQSRCHFIRSSGALTCCGSAAASQWWRSARLSPCWACPRPWAWGRNTVSSLPRPRNTPARPRRPAPWLHLSGGGEGRVKCIEMKRALKNVIKFKSIQLSSIREISTECQRPSSCWSPVFKNMFWCLRKTQPQRHRENQWKQPRFLTFSYILLISSLELKTSCTVPQPEAQTIFCTARITHMSGMYFDAWKKFWPKNK